MKRCGEKIVKEKKSCCGVSCGGGGGGGGEDCALVVGGEKQPLFLALLEGKLVNLLFGVSSSLCSNNS